MCHEHGFPFYLALATVTRGWALAQQGEVEEGITQIHQGLTAHQATGAALVKTYFLALLAQTYGLAGQFDEGLKVLTDALEIADKTRECYWEAELYRLEGELLVQLETEGLGQTQEEAEACFLKAIEVARHHAARSLELRATVSLSRYWHNRGKSEEAYKILKEICDWFTEGFDTVELKEAQTLVAALS